MNLRKTGHKVIGLVVNTVTNRVSQTGVKRGRADDPPDETAGPLCLRAAAESFVLLKNEGNILPLPQDRTTAVFGRVQFDPFFVGYGSGGDVNAHYTVDFNKGLHRAGVLLDATLENEIRRWRKKNPADHGYWGHWPFSFEEMPLTEALVRSCAQRADTAVYFIGRAAGEDRDNRLIPGSYYLTDVEKRNLRLVRRYFDRCAVILNIGGMIDLSYFEEIGIPCVGICWLGGMEAGNAVGEILSGKASPCGKLTDTAARAYALYPTAGNFGEKDKNRYEEDVYVGYRYFETFAKQDVLYPFGYGLGYTAFSLRCVSFETDGTGVRLRCAVKNIGRFPGKETAQLYVSHAGGPPDSPDRRLVAFQKTDTLAPDEETVLDLAAQNELFAVFDDDGGSGHANAWVLPAGEYTFYLGTDVRSAAEVGRMTIEKTIPLRRCKAVLPPKPEERLMRLSAVRTGERTVRTYRPASTSSDPLRERILSSLPRAFEDALGRPVLLEEVINEPTYFDSFIAQLTDEELEAITRGDYVMNSPLGPTGNAGVFGGVTASLREKGLAPITTTDGPSGIRLSATASLLPCGTALACAWDPALIESLYSMIGREMTSRGSDVLLAPGINLHRDPVGGRNFEYFSEDPLLTAVCAAAVVKGLKNVGVSACPKHFACNDQEYNRTKNDSVVSERALREVHLRAFELCVKLADPDVIMTSYNKVNGIWSHYSYPLVTELLRNEWGFHGVVITDWWMRSAVSPEFPALSDQAYRVRAGVDVLMPGGNRSGKRKPDGTLLAALNAPDGITRGELQAAAAHVVLFALKKNKIIYHLSKEETIDENHEL